MHQDSSPLASRPAPIGDFLVAARAYKHRLTQTVTASECRELWQATSLPYELPSAKPFSLQYRREVETVYAGLTGHEYDIGAELTSTKQDDAKFQIGYPWVTRDLSVITQEMSKAIQAFQALSIAGATGRVVEFGAGWGNLALPLARAGLNVTTVDIDPAFNARLQRLAAGHDTRLTTFQGSFLDASLQLAGPFDTVIFQSSFHHCLDFDDLLSNITRRLLDANGRILFLSEPIMPDLAFPWGIRYDGEALWAVIFHGWLELGFQQNFFLDLLFHHGLLAARVPGIPGMVGGGWSATRAERGLAFAELVLPSGYDQTFHPVEGDAAWGRYCRRRSRLPGTGTSACKLSLRNFGTQALNIEFRSSDRVLAVHAVAGQQGAEVDIPTAGADIDILSDVFVPNHQYNNGDLREIGLAVLSARWERA